MITLTERAAKYFASILKTSGNNVIRVRLIKTGCSGYAYDLIPEDNYHEWESTDHVMESYEINIVCSENDLPLLSGMEIDIIDIGLTQKVIFSNPNALDSCGCGESVRFK